MNTTQRQKNWTNYWKSNATDSCRQGIKAKDAQLDEFWAEGADKIKHGDTVLDLCTGKGDVIKQLITHLGSTSNGSKFIGVDISDLDEALADNDDRIELQYNISVTDLPFEDGTFDMVTSQFGIEYGLNERSIAEFCRVLKKDGVIRFALHHKESILINVAKEEIKHIQLLLSDSGYLKCISNLIPIFAKLKNPANAKKLSNDSDAILKRDAFNKESQKIIDCLKNTSVPELLEDSLKFSHRVFEIAKKSRALAKKEAAKYESQLREAKERMEELIEVSLSVSDLHELDKKLKKYEKKISFKKELRNNDEIVAWGVEIR